MPEQVRLESSQESSMEGAPIAVAGATFPPLQRDPADAIKHLSYQIDEIRKLNKRLELINSALLAENRYLKSSIHFRIADKAYNFIRRWSITRRAARLLLRLAMQMRGAFRRIATRP